MVHRTSTSREGTATLVTLGKGQYSNIATEKRPGGDEDDDATPLVGLVGTTNIDNYAIFLD